MNKKGQFYLIAALALVSAVIGFITVTNSGTVVQNSGISNLKEEIGIESSNVIAYGNYHSFDESQMQALLTNLAESYINSSDNYNLYFIFGTNSTFNFVGYQSTNYSVYVNGSYQDMETGNTYIKSMDPGGENTTLQVGKDSYLFNLNEGENFYYVLYNLNNGEVYTVRS